MSRIDSVVEAQIKQSLQRGDDKLPSKFEGKRFNLNEYFAVPQAFRMAFSLLKKAGTVPVEITQINELKRLKSQLASTEDQAERKALNSEFNKLNTTHQIMMDRYRRR